MLVTGKDSTADTDSRRGFILRWLAVGLVLLALGLAGFSTAHAHPSQDDPVDMIVTLQDATALENAECCHEAQHEHGSENCSVPGHCGGCAVDDGRIAAPVPPLDAHPGQRLTTLRAGLVTGPAGHPPKTI